MSTARTVAHAVALGLLARAAQPAPAAAAPVIPAIGQPVGPAQVVGQNPGIPGSIIDAAGGSNASMHEFESGMDYRPLPPGARITFNLQDADLPDLVRAIGNITGRRFIIPGKVRSAWA